MTRCDAFDLKILASVASEFENFSCEIFKYSSGIHCRSGANATACVDSCFENAVNSANGELNHDKKKNLTTKIDISNVQIKNGTYL